MEFKFGGSETNQKTVLGHPSGLFVLFFTEMWERFSYYGMRALLVLFLVSSLLNEGWAWERSDALILFAWYTGLVYITPIVGGWIADKFIGYRKTRSFPGISKLALELLGIYLYYNAISSEINVFFFRDP